LRTYGVRGVISDFFHSYLSDKYQLTHFEEAESLRIIITGVVPQGSIWPSAIRTLYK